MLDTMPYADLLAIYNAIADKPVTRFDTRANGSVGRGLTPPEAARLADVVLLEDNAIREEAPTRETAARGALQGDDADPNQTEADAAPNA